MFYCNTCKDIYNYPESFVLSYGKCEMCGETSECYDVPSSALPKRESSEEEVDIQATLDTVARMHSSSVDAFLDETVDKLSHFSKTSQKVMLGRIAQRLGLKDTFEGIKESLRS